MVWSLSRSCIFQTSQSNWTMPVGLCSSQHFHRGLKTSASNLTTLLKHLSWLRHLWPTVSLDTPVTHTSVLALNQRILIQIFSDLTMMAEFTGRVAEQEPKVWALCFQVGSCPSSPAAPPERQFCTANAPLLLKLADTTVTLCYFGYLNKTLLNCF